MAGLSSKEKGKTRWYKYDYLYISYICVCLYLYFINEMCCEEVKQLKRDNIMSKEDMEIAQYVM